jgi:Xaa-Pro aminopeptidase
MVITIEPGTCKSYLTYLTPSAVSLVCDSDITIVYFNQGVYVPADPQFPKHFHGLGMRIEDEVLVGAEHPVVLSASAPKEV